MSDQILFTVTQVAEALSVGRTKVYELIGSGRLRSVKIDGSRRVTASALAEFADSLEQEGAGVV